MFCVLCKRWDAAPLNLCFFDFLSPRSYVRGSGGQECPPYTGRSKIPTFAAKNAAKMGHPAALPLDSSRGRGRPRHTKTASGAYFALDIRCDFFIGVFNVGICGAGSAAEDGFFY
jgi:hypothetical protein